MKNQRADENQEPDFRFLYDAEIQLFARRNKNFALAFDKLNSSIDQIVKQVRTDTSERLNVTIYMLSRLCIRHYESILLLASTGHGFSATRILRSMFEKLVDALYLKLEPSNLDDYWDYYFVEMKKMGYEHIAAKMDADYKEKIRRFEGKKNKRSRWSTLNLVSQAKKVGFDEDIIRMVYRHSNSFVHSSLDEILSSLLSEQDGSLTPTEGSSEQERRTADVAVTLSTHLIRNVLQLLVQHFQLTKPPEFDEFFTAFDTNF